MANLFQKAARVVRGTEVQEPLMYRVHLFRELVELTGGESFVGERILEIGPKDGLDSRRLTSLRPSELVLLDLPERRDGSRDWLGELPASTRYISANINYLSQAELEALGRFRLVWFTGVLYHNAEQLRLLRKLYKLLIVGGHLVLESATLRTESSLLREGSYVQVFYPETYRDTGTITHLPSAGAIRAWLQMVGFQEIHDSRCYLPENRNLLGERYACLCRKTGEDDAGTYYARSGANPSYRFGDST